MGFFYRIRDKKKRGKEEEKRRILVESPVGSWSGRIFFNPFSTW